MLVLMLVLMFVLMLVLMFVRMLVAPNLRDGESCLLSKIKIALASLAT